MPERGRPAENPATRSADSFIAKRKEPLSNKLMRYSIYGGIGSLALIYAGLAVGAMTAAAIGGFLLPVTAGTAVIGAVASAIRKRKNFA